MNTLARLAALAALVGAAACSGGTGPDGDQPGDGYPFPTGKVFFTHPPIGLDGVFYFESMGAMFVTFQEDHGGFFHDQIDLNEPTIPITAPADGQVIGLRTHEGPSDDFEYAVNLKISTTIDVLWGHIGRLSEPFASQAPTSLSTRNVAIPVGAGDTIGYVGRSAIDFAVNDQSVINPRILHPEFYGPNSIAAPIEDYYREPLRSQLIALTIRETSPRTGSYGYDVAGTLAGLWYLEGFDPRPEYRTDRAFHFGSHHLVTDRTNIVDGLALAEGNTNWQGSQLYNFWVKNSPRWEDITPASGVVVLEMFPSRSGLAGSWPDDFWLEDTTGLDAVSQTQSILLVEMLDEDTVRLERFDAPDRFGISPGDVAGFTANARTYHRDPVG